MIVRKFDSLKDYQDVCGWWSKQNWPQIPEIMLGNQGFIVENNEKMVAAWLLKFEEIPMCSIEWMIGNPNIDKKIRSLAIDNLINYICDYAKKENILFVTCSSVNKRVIDKFVKNGFVKDDSSFTHLMRVL